MSSPPTREQVRSWLKVSPAQVSDEELDQILAGEVVNQAKVCTVEPYGADLRDAVYRRCARHLAARGTPLGLTGDAEYGAARLPFFDSEIERLEGPSREFVFG